MQELLQTVEALKLKGFRLGSMKSATHKAYLAKAQKIAVAKGIRSPILAVAVEPKSKSVANYAFPINGDDWSKFRNMEGLVCTPAYTSSTGISTKSLSDRYRAQPGRT